MIAISEEQKRLKIVRDAQHNLYRVLFSTKYIAEYFAMVMVTASIILATFIHYTGLFLTSQSQSLSHYHRWLYDLFVIVGCGLGPVLFFILKQKRQNPSVQQYWAEYVKAQALFKKRLRKLKRVFTK